ncbi:MAG: FliI/YscN family ATPase [Puniceicoccaceae bacterium]
MRNNLTSLNVDSLKERLKQATPAVRSGTVYQVRGLVIEAYGPNLAIGDMCRVETRDGSAILAEVVGFSDHRMLLMPLDDMARVAPGCSVTAAHHEGAVPVGESLLGRIVDGMGKPIDEKGKLHYDYNRTIVQAPPNPLKRNTIESFFTTGIRAIDTFSPIGRGQRMGLFAGSGVGKSTLLGMLAQSSEADVNVIALIGERGREVREFVERILNPEDLARTIIVVSTSDQPAMVRLRAAYMATSVAEYFRDKGANVLFMMDSVTRFAMAQREIGLSIGEPPASRGYPPSVFSLLPRLLERTGNSDSGSITAFYTVLVEGDDMNEPIADSVRGILDGHIVLSRAIATANIFPAIDVLESISRLSTAICTHEELEAVARARELLALYRENEDLISIGAYVRNSNPKIDRAIEKRDQLIEFFRQRMLEGSTREESYTRLKEIIS